MGYVTGDNYNPALAPAVMQFQLLFERGRDAELEQLMMAQDEIDRRDVNSRLQQFSCKEEMERYVVNKAQVHRL